MKLSLRRAAGAVGLALATLAGTLSFGTPAAHAVSVTTQIIAHVYTSYGEAYAYIGTDSSNHVYELVQGYNTVNDGNHCIDVVVDIALVGHRPADLFPVCRGGYQGDWLPIHWARESDYGYGNPVLWPTQMSNAITPQNSPLRVAVCDVDVVPNASDHWQRTTSNCTAASSQPTIPPIMPGVITHLDWSPMTWSQIWAIPCVHGTCDHDEKPEYQTYGDLDIVPMYNNLYSGDLAVAWGGQYRTKHQVSDGNLVTYGNLNTAKWAASNCLTAGHSLHNTDYVAMQSDGNLVIYNSAGQPQWASAAAGYNSCYLGSFTSGGSPFLKMQDDGNLVIYSSPTGGIALWASSWDGATLP